VELFKQISIDWLGKKWWFFGFSWILIVLGLIGYVANGWRLTYGIDFTGGTVIILKFREKPDLELIRKSLQTESPTPPLIQSYGPAAKNEILARLQVFGSEKAIESGRPELLTLLRKAFDSKQVNNFNIIGEDELNNYLMKADPDNLKNQNRTPKEISDYYKTVAQSLVKYRYKTSKGLLKSMDELKNASVSDAVITSLSKDFFAGSLDFDNIGRDALYKYLLGADSDNRRSQNKTTQEVDDYYQTLTQLMMDYRNDSSKDLIHSIEDLKKVHCNDDKKAPCSVSDAVIADLKKDFYAGPFAIVGMDSISGIVGSDLKRRAILVVGLSFVGMLIYIAFRFKPIYGVAAVVALFHDLAVTLGLFALTRKEISLTVIAALLTLVGYSMNDTIVVFDRVRENLRVMRKETLTQILNLSINQTFARTIMTSFTTFISVLALFVFGGEVLNGFSFALTVGILIGTYSSIGIASPIVEWWYKSFDQKSKRKVA
jgi:preprotein translocase SecF subunit